MSAYAALVSLLQILETVLHAGGLRIIHTSAQLHNLREDVKLLLNFLEISCNYEAGQMSDLERRMRDASREAEHIIDHWINPQINSYFHYSFIFLLSLLLGLEVITVCVWYPFISVEVVICTIIAVYLHLWHRQEYGIPTRKTYWESRQVFYDFEIIVKDVIRITESSEMSAHAALVSLRQILDTILESGYSTDDHLKSLHEMVSLLLDNHHSSTLDATIEDAVCKAKRALIEFQLPSMSSLIFDRKSFGTPLDALCFVIVSSFISIYFRFDNHIPYYQSISVVKQISIAFASYMCSVVIVLAVLAVQYNYEAPENQELPHVIDDFSLIVRVVINIKDACGNPSDSPNAAAASSRQDFVGTSKDVVVGLERDIEEIKALIVQDSSKLEVISIVGMGGIGKTTLAHKVYQDPGIADRFDVFAWTTISQDNSLHHVLRSLLDSAHMLTGEENCGDSDEELGVHLHKYLTGRRYLIVVDDVWDTKIWGFLSRHFPENYNHSRVLLTSRLPNVVSCLDSSSRLHRMQCLSETDGWNLLCVEVFGMEGCPLELESIGREIAQRCGGLPLAIVVIGGLLSQHIKIQVWRDISEKLKQSEVQGIKEKCLDILGLSYSHLPHHLRPCFLYMGVSLAHREIPISTLTHLWIAEGFLRPDRHKSLEEVAEGYVNDLIDRNLILVGKRSCSGKIKTCSMHDLLRDVCVQHAQMEKFCHVESGGYVIIREGPDESRRSLSIHPIALLIEGVPCSVLLRVLSALGLDFGKFPRRITKLGSLRYLALQSDCSTPLPPSIFKLRYLETLVLHNSSFGKYSFLPSSIWRMSNLRHIYVKPDCYMFKPFWFRYSLLKNLQTLVGIRNFRWTKSITGNIPNLKKLGISYDFSSSTTWSTYQLKNLVYLEKLETLKITVKYDDLGSAMSHDPPKLAFPQKLKKLSLSGCRIPWENMSAIGELPNLGALKLRCEAFSGPSWVTLEVEFPRLVFLLLEEMSFTTWESEESHFPCLQRLVLRSCDMLEEIPFSFGDIPTLEMMKLVNCHPSAEASAKKIQEEQENSGNEVLQFYIEQGRREAGEMVFGKSEARGTGPGVFQVIGDAMVSNPWETLNAFLTVCFNVSLIVWYR